jgi:hypothetical protein
LCCWRGAAASPYERLLAHAYLVILHPRIGGAATASVAAHVQAPLIGLGLGMIAVHYLAEPIGTRWALAAGMAITIVWNAALWAWRTRTKLI